MRNRRHPSRNVGATTLQILPLDLICPIFKRQQEAVPGDLMSDSVEQERPEKLKKSSWWWPGVVASSLAGAAVLAFRGCWRGVKLVKVVPHPVKRNERARRGRHCFFVI